MKLMPSFFRKPKKQSNVPYYLCGGMVLLLVIGIWVFLKTKNQDNFECKSLPAAEKIQQADLIVSGKVFLVLADGPENAKVLFTADKIYKGQMPEGGIEIFAKQSTAIKNPSTNCELHFASNNQEYLLYLKKGEDGLFTTSKCFGSRLLGNGLSSEEFSILGEGQVVNQT
jgi:hypothetical protein